MSLYIKKFVDRLQHFEQKGAKDFNCPISDAKNLHAELTRILCEIDDLRSRQMTSAQMPTEIEVQGGSF